MLIPAKKSQAFTIIELLIVVVIIAILAAITLVAYNGIQVRAQLSAQVSEVDKIGKAIQLWSAENGTSLGSSGAGANGQGYGYFQVKNTTSYTAVSIQDLLTNAGYFNPSSINSSVLDLSKVLISACTTTSDPRWVVIATVSPAPQESVANQIADTGCTYSLIPMYTDPAGQYKRNLVRAY